MLSNGRCARAFLPISLAGFRGTRDKACTSARACHFADTFGGGIKVGFVIRDDVSQEYHLGHAATFFFGAIAYGAHIAPVDVFKASELYRFVVTHVVTHFHNGGRGLCDRPIEFQADRTAVGRHTVKHKGCGHDDPVGAFFLNGRQATEILVSDVFP